MKFSIFMLEWRVRAVADLLVLASVGTIMGYQDAPAWALALLFYIGTRPSRLDMAGDLSAIQTSIKAKAKEDSP